METWRPDLNDENEPKANLNVFGGEFEVNRGNTRLYTFMGRLAMYNHVFCKNDEETGFYIFNFVGGFDTLQEFIVQNEFPMYLNQTEVPQCDLDAYDRTLAASTKDIDHVPEEWL